MKKTTSFEIRFWRSMAGTFCKLYLSSGIILFGMGIWIRGIEETQRMSTIIVWIALGSAFIIEHIHYWANKKTLEKKYASQN